MAHLHPDLLVYALLLLLYLLLELLDGGSIWRSAVCLEDLDIPSRCQLRVVGAAILGSTDSSVRGVIFFSSTSSSAKFFLYFSQFCPVAEGYERISTQEAAGRVATGSRRTVVGRAYHDDDREER
jgi:hypothetical protein